MVLTKFEMHGTEGVDHSKQVSKKQHPKVFEELSCIMEKDFFCIIFGPVFGNYRKKISGQEECSVKGEMEQRCL